MDGYIILQRKFFEGQFWDEKRVFSKAEAWIDLVREARFEKEPKTTFIKGKSVTWNRGELPVSLRFLADRWGWSKNKVDHFIKFLTNDGALKTRTHEGTAQTIITLCNYESYNPVSSNEGTAKGTPKGQQRDKTNKGNNIISKDIMPSLIETIIEFLNEKTGRTFGVKTAESVKLISGWLKKGYKVEDFFAVIETKAQEWKGHPKMHKHLCPSTLFDEKFERYLEESQARVVAHPASEQSQQQSYMQNFLPMNY